MKIKWVSGEVVAELEIGHAASQGEVRYIKDVKRHLQSACLIPFCQQSLLDDVEVLADHADLVHRLASELTLVVSPFVIGLEQQLMSSARRGHVARVQKALEAPQNPDTTDQSLRTPLYLAANRGHCEVVRLLCEMGALHGFKGCPRGHDS